MANVKYTVVTNGSDAIAEQIETFVKSKIPDVGVFILLAAETATGFTHLISDVSFKTDRAKLLHASEAMLSLLKDPR